MEKNDIQQRLEALQDKGWTLAAIASELDVTRRTVDYWRRGHIYPEHAKSIGLALDQLLERKRIPKRRRYSGTHHLQQSNRQEDSSA